MSTMTETHSFEAEVTEVLNLVIHSLYTNREIFLRELISNASDALDKLHFEALTDATLVPEGEALGIALDFDAEARVLRVADNGIGMTRDELTQNLGTIASSGTRRFLEALKEQGKESSPDLIGQFGVGFYSSFMVADRVTVETRRAGEDEGWRWTSTGDGEYTIEAAEGLARGTLIQLHLREGEEEDAELTKRLLSEWGLREIVKKYSDFVEHPIQMEVERTEPKKDDQGEELEGETETVRSTETLNSMKPLWARPKSEIEEAEYAEFYKHISHDWNDPLDTIHFRAEGALEYTALLYLPKERPFDLFETGENKSKVSLYVRRVLIMRDSEDLLPTWLRFVRGVVECSDLPLNVSRETLQDNPKVRQIQKRLVKKVLETFGKMLENEREAYDAFWMNFGIVIKEGLYYGEDEDNRVSKLCLFESSNGDGLTTLDEYIGRAPADQDVIYTINGPDRKTVEASPHLEALLEKGHEVLFLVDPVDEWVMQRFTEYAGKQLKAIEKGDVDLDTDDEKKAREEKQETHKDLLAAIQSALDENVSEVRFSSRLKESPAVLVSAEHAMSPHLERMLKRSGQDVPSQKRVLELNPDHVLVTGLAALHGKDSESARLKDYSDLLFGQALLTEGSALPDPGRFSKLVTDLLVGAVEQ